MSKSALATSTVAELQFELGASVPEPLPLPLPPPSTPGFFFEEEQPTATASSAAAVNKVVEERDMGGETGTKRLALSSDIQTPIPTAVVGCAIVISFACRGAK